MPWAFFRFPLDKLAPSLNRSLNWTSKVLVFMTATAEKQGAALAMGLPSMETEQAGKWGDKVLASENFCYSASLTSAASYKHPAAAPCCAVQGLLDD